MKFHNRMCKYPMEKNSVSKKKKKKKKKKKILRLKMISGERKREGEVIYKALCFDVAQGQMNGAPNETRTHSCRFASLAC